MAVKFAGVSHGALCDTVRDAAADNAMDEPRDMRQLRIMAALEYAAMAR